jgi:hypothetical protein
MDITKRPEFARGRAGEQVVAAWLQERGWYVIPSYDYCGEDGNKAPKLMGLRTSYPVPDLDVARNGVRRWVEVKTKTAASLFRKTNSLDHGIEHRLYESYLRVAAETGTECWIAVYETSTGDLLCQRLTELGEPRKSTMNGAPMAYWPRARFSVLHTFDRPPP